MDKYAGFKVATFIIVAGVSSVIPISMKSPKIVEPTYQSEEVVEYIEPFRIDYELYGVYDTNKVLGCVSNRSYDYTCTVWLEDLSGNHITHDVKLRPMERSLAFETNWQCDTNGEYEMRLVYKVNSSRIECPYFIQVMEVDN